MTSARIGAIYKFEMARAWRTSPEHRLARHLDVAVFRRVRRRHWGTHQPDRRASANGAFIVPGLVMLLAAYPKHRERVIRNLFPRFTRHDLRSSVGAIWYIEIVLAYVGAAASKSIILGAIILLTAGFFVPFHTPIRSGW